MGGQHHALAGLSPGKEILCPLYRRLSGTRGQSGRVRQILSSPGLEPHTVQPVASRYTDYTIPAAPKWGIPVTLHKPYFRIEEGDAKLTHIFQHALCLTKREGNIVCIPRKRWRHAISKPVQWQWIGGICSVLMGDEEHFHVSGIRSPDLTVPDFFLCPYLKQYGHTGIAHTQHRSWNVLFRIRQQP